MLSVIVPATDSPPTLSACERAIRAALPEGGELIVVREPSTDGPAAARNRGAAAARGDILVFVDADVVVHDQALPRIEAAFAADPALAAVFGSYDERPAARGIVSRYRNLLHHHVHTTSPGEAETFWAGLGAVRREAFERVGGFDAERFGSPAVEDIELGMRLRAAGGRIVLDPAIRGTHLKAWTLRSMVATDFARRGVPWTRLQLERGRAAGGLNLTPARRLSALAAAGMAVALLARRRGLALGLAGASTAANASLFALLGRQGGLRLAAAGVPLHLLHQLTAVASVPAAVGAHLASRLRPGSDA